MAWQDTLSELQDELAEIRAERRQQADVEEAQIQQARMALTGLAASIGIPEMLSQMNATLLDGKAELETILSWEDFVDEGDDVPEITAGDDEDDGDAVTSILSWDERGEREIVVDVIAVDGGPSLQVNGVDIRPDRDALEQALVEAFREELEL